MTTFYLKATDEQSLWEALEAASLAEKHYDPEDENNQRPVDLATDADWSPSGAYEWRKIVPMLDIIGVIHKPTGEVLTNEDGLEYNEMAAVEGYHANYRGSLSPDQKAVLPILAKPPKNPHRKWAGDE